MGTAKEPVKERCYPEYSDLTPRQASHIEEDGQVNNDITSGFYDVAIWRFWPPYGLPYIADHVPAVSGFAAIRKTMKANGLRLVGHASACPCGGQWFQVYRAFGIRLREKPSQPVWLAMLF